MLIKRGHRAKWQRAAGGGQRGTASRAPFIVLFIVGAIALSPALVPAEWAFSGAHHLPLVPDHEHSTTFNATLVYKNETGSGQPGGGNGTGNSTGGNGTGGNNTAGNQTGNQTALNATVNLTAVHLVLEPMENTSHQNVTRVNMSRLDNSTEYTVTLGPWAPGEVFRYHFEARLANGTVVRSNESLVRTPDIVNISWHHSYEEARELASALDRVLLVLVYSDFDRNTAVVEDEVLDRAQILGLSARFVCTRVTNDSAGGPAARLGVQRIPAVVFVNATTGEVLARLEYPFDAPRLELEMRYILDQGPKPENGPRPQPDYRLGVAMLAVALTLGPGAMYLVLRRRKKRRD